MTQKMTFHVTEKWTWKLKSMEYEMRNLTLLMMSSLTVQQIIHIAFMFHCRPDKNHVFDYIKTLNLESQWKWQTHTWAVFFLFKPNILKNHNTSLQLDKEINKTSLSCLLSFPTILERFKSILISDKPKGQANEQPAV